jgi:hypothetical protein
MPLEWPPGLQQSTKERFASILWALHEAGGEVLSDNGTAPSRLNDICRDLRVRRVPKTNPSQYTYLLARLAGDHHEAPWAEPVIERKVRGKRTYAIRLLLDETDMPDPALAWRPADMPDRLKAPGESEDVATTVEPEPEQHETEPARSAPGHLRKAMAIQKLATDLMVELSAPPETTDADKTAERLAVALDENARLRNQVQALNNVVEAKTAEISALRHSLKLTGANLETLRVAMAGNGHQKAADEERQRKTLNALMAAPSPTT